MKSTLALVTLSALALGAVAQAPCDAGWRYYPDLEGTEEGAQPLFSGSCLQLFDSSVIALDPSKAFATSSNDFCTAAHNGGHLLSFSSGSISANALIAYAKSVMAPSSTSLVLIGGTQDPNSAAGSNKYSNWIWTDYYTDPSIINMSPGSFGNIWGPGQPEYVRGKGQRVREGSAVPLLSFLLWRALSPCWCRP